MAYKDSPMTKSNYASSNLMFKTVWEREQYSQLTLSSDE